MTDIDALIARDDNGEHIFLSEAMAAVREQQTEIERLRAALMPFAREADTWSETISDRFKPGVCEPRSKFSHAKAEFSLGDLRRARAALGGRDDG